MNEKLPKGWRKVTFGEVVAYISRGITPKYSQKGLIVINQKCIRYGRVDFSFSKRHDPLKKVSRDKILKRYDTLINSTGVGTLGRIAILKNIDEVCVVDSHVTIVRANTKIDKLFLYYKLLSLKREVEFLAEGSTGQIELPRSKLKELEIEIPESIDEQRAIASVLSSLDDKIDLLHRQNKTLEQTAETIFRKWFVEDAKEDWEERPLKEIYNFEKGFEPGSKNYLEEKEFNTIRFVRVGNMLNSQSAIYINRNIAQKVCARKDLLVSFDGTVGRTVFGIEGAYSSGIRKIYSENPMYDNLGLKYLIFNSKDIQDLIRSHATGTVILHASSSINYLTFNFPPHNTIKEFDSIISPMFDKILENKIQIHTLEKLRDTLLPKLISGEVKVRC